MITTKICEKIGIKYPVFQGGMAHISDAVLAAAVSDGGGLGIISAASGDIKQIAAEIDKLVRAELMGKNAPAVTEENDEDNAPDEENMDDLPLLGGEDEE